MQVLNLAVSDTKTVRKEHESFDYTYLWQEFFIWVSTVLYENCQVLKVKLNQCVSLSPPKVG